MSVLLQGGGHGATAFFAKGFHLLPLKEPKISHPPKSTREINSDFGQNRNQKHHSAVLLEVISNFWWLLHLSQLHFSFLLHCYMVSKILHISKASIHFHILEMSFLYLKLTLFFPLFKLQPQLQLLQSSSVHCILGILELNDLVKNCSKLIEKYLWDR